MGLEGMRWDGMGCDGTGVEHAEEASPRCEWHCQHPRPSFKAEPLHLGGSSLEEPITWKPSPLVAGMCEADLKMLRGVLLLGGVRSGRLVAVGPEPT